MKANDKQVLAELAKRYHEGEDIERITHKDLGMDLDKFNDALENLIQKGYLPNGTVARNPKGRDIYFSGKELSDEAKEIVADYL